MHPNPFRSLMQPLGKAMLTSPIFLIMLFGSLPGHDVHASTFWREVIGSMIVVVFFCIIRVIYTIFVREPYQAPKLGQPPTIQYPPMSLGDILKAALGIALMMSISTALTCLIENHTLWLVLAKNEICIIPASIAMMALTAYRFKQYQQFNTPVPPQISAEHAAKS